MRDSFSFFAILDHAKATSNITDDIRRRALKYLLKDYLSEANILSKSYLSWMEPFLPKILSFELIKEMLPNITHCICSFSFENQVSTMILELLKSSLEELSCRNMSLDFDVDEVAAFFLSFVHPKITLRQAYLPAQVLGKFYSLMSNGGKRILISKVCSTNLLLKIDLLPLITSKAILTATKSQEERIFAQQHLVENFLTNLRIFNCGLMAFNWPFEKHWHNLLKNHDRSFGDEVFDQISKSPDPFVTYQELLEILLSFNLFKTKILSLVSNFLLNSGPESFESTANSTLGICT